MERILWNLVSSLPLFCSVLKNACFCKLPSTPMTSSIREKVCWNVPRVLPPAGWSLAWGWEKVLWKALWWGLPGAAPLAMSLGGSASWPNYDQRAHFQHSWPFVVAKKLTAYLGIWKQNIPALSVAPGGTNTIATGKPWLRVKQFCFHSRLSWCEMLIA